MSIVSATVAQYLAAKSSYDAQPGGFVIDDAAAHIAASLDQMNDPKCLSVVVSDSAPLTITAGQLTSDALTLAKLINADGSSGRLAISDTAAHISADFDAIVAAAAHIVSLHFTDAGVPVLSLTQGRATALSGLLPKAPLGGFGLAGFKLTIDTGVLVAPTLSANRDDLSFLPGQAAVAIGPGGEVLFSTTGGFVQLVGVTEIRLSDAIDTISGNVVTQTYPDGSKDVATFNISGQPFRQKVLSYGADGKIDGKIYAGVTTEGDPYENRYLYAGGNFIGAHDYVFSDVAGPSRSAYYFQETDTDGAGRVTRAAFVNIVGAPYSAYEYDYVGGVFAGSKFTFTSAPAGASYASYEVDYDRTNALAGQKFFTPSVTGQDYTGEEQDFDASGKLSRVLLTGITDRAYGSLELDYSAGTYEGYKAFYDVSGKPYAHEEVDVSAAGKLEKVVYSGMTGAPYTSVEQDYSGGTLAEVVYGFTGVTGKTYNAYQVTFDASGKPLQETFDLNSGGHAEVALAPGQTLTSLGNDKMTGSATGATHFVLNAVYGADTITNLTSLDTVSLPTSEFADFAALTSHATQSGANVVVTAVDGDSLTLKGMTTTALAGMGSNFTFHG